MFHPDFYKKMPSKKKSFRGQIPKTLLGIMVLAVMLILSGCGGGGEESASGAGSQPAENTGFSPEKTYLPVLTINTTGGQDITSKEEYITGTYELADTDGAVLNSGDLEIKGRGNTTWKQPKKPYHFKLAKKAALLGMPSNKHWVLLANYLDEAIIRNDVAFKLSALLNMEYTTRSVFVEMYLNGNYRGVYQLTEHIRIDKERVNIPELTKEDTSPELISGGYLIEVDSHRGEDFCLDSEKTEMVFCLKNPETLLEEGWEPHRQYITDYLRQTEEAIFGENFRDPDNGYAAFIDVDSAVGYYLVNELLKNMDANLKSSFYLYKKRSGKLTFGPVWDFDTAMGSLVFDNSAQGWLIRIKAAWYQRLFEDPVFEQKVKNRWAQMKAEGVLDALFDHIDQQISYLNDVQSNNFQKWPMLNMSTFAKETDFLKEWLIERIAWMDAQLSD